MTSELGSLPEFLPPLRKLRIVPTKIPPKILNKDINESISQTRTPPPKIFKVSPHSFQIMESNTQRRLRKREVLPSLSPLGVFEKIREELILRNQQRLLRCMHTTIREEERQKTQALLEQRALDAVLKSMTDDLQKPLVNSRKKFSGKIIHSKKSALYLDTISKEKLWIYKRKPIQDDSYYLY